MTTTDPFAGVPALLRRAMERRGFTALSAVQQAVITADSLGRNLRISSQTGSGKTVAIGLVLAEALLDEPKPAEPKADEPKADERKRGKQRGGSGLASPRALIIVPTRELAVQVQSELVWLFEELPSLKVNVVTGGSDLRRERDALRRGPSIVVGTPGRLLDHLRSHALDACNMRQVVLDEADRMLDMGFREELEAIVECLPKERRSHLVSATFGAAVRHLADRFQDQPLVVEGTALGTANQDIEHVAHLVRHSDRYAALVNTLLAAQGSRCLVFVERRTETAEIAERLAGDGFAALPFSGELAQAQRTRTLAAFRNGSVEILVSTDVAARGIDVPDIGVVIQMTLPNDPDSYTHRCGRTGRAGRTGQSVIFVAASAERKARRLFGGARIRADWRPVPDPSQIRKLARKAFRRDLHGRLDASEVPSEQQLAYAKKLLEERDAVQLIATLMQMAEPSEAREPMEVATLTPGAHGAPESRGRTGRAGSAASRGEEYTSFAISWGKSSGATTPRLLSHICRRGGISARDVGAIRMGPGSSHFEVRSQVADAFERSVAKPDSRDPGVHIRRDRSGAPPRGGRPSAAARTKSLPRSREPRRPGSEHRPERLERSANSPRSKPRKLPRGKR